jgi:hypothetical protein
LELILPAHRDTIQLLELVDVWLVVAVFCLFAVYTFAILIVRLWRSFTRELRAESRAAETSLEVDKS